MEEAKFQLKRLVRDLDKIRGRHTELVTVYVPKGYNLDAIKSHLASEADTASNIKSKSVRTNVVTAIEKMITELKKYKKTPDNGMVLFSGNVSEVEGKPDYKIWTIHPPEPVNVRLYRCAQTFVLDPLKDMLEAKYVYGLVVLDHKEANIGILKGKQIVFLKDMESQVMGKFRKGGQSAPRFQRERQEQIKHFYKKIAMTMKEAFFEIENLQGILVGGPGPAKEDFVNSGYILDAVHKKIIGVKDVSDTGQHGIRELVNKSTDILAQEAIIAEKQILDVFFAHLAKDNGLASYGSAEIENNLKLGAVDVLLLSEALPDTEIDKFTDLAKQFGTRIELISEQTPEGIQLKELGGLGAILRYKVN